jgi:NTP pyrophosphatase (non-canonical NTP hydrolase)
MTDADTSLAVLRKMVIAFRDERDWKQYHTPKDLALAITVEAGELAEAFLWKAAAEVSDALGSEDYRTRIADEMADVLIYLLCMAEATDIDLSEAVTAKVRKNEVKYPVHLARGSARKYTELHGGRSESVAADHVE